MNYGIELINRLQANLNEYGYTLEVSGEGGDEGDDFLHFEIKNVARYDVNKIARVVLNHDYPTVDFQIKMGETTDIEKPFIIKGTVALD